MVAPNRTDGIPLPGFRNLQWHLCGTYIAGLEQNELDAIMKANLPSASGEPPDLAWPHDPDVSTTVEALYAASCASPIEESIALSTFALHVRHQNASFDELVQNLNEEQSDLLELAFHSAFVLSPLAADCEDFLRVYLRFQAETPGFIPFSLAPNLTLLT